MYTNTSSRIKKSGFEDLISPQTSAPYPIQTKDTGLVPGFLTCVPRRLARAQSSSRIKQFGFKYLFVPQTSAPCPILFSD